MGGENNVLRNIYTGSLYRVMGMPKQRTMDVLTVCQKVRRTRLCSLQSVNWCVGVGGIQWAEASWGGGGGGGKGGWGGGGGGNWGKITREGGLAGKK